MTAAPMTGRCMCGAVTVTMTPASEELHACHCGLCRQWSGSAFVAIDAAPGTLKAEGPIAVFPSSEWAERARCGECGTPLWYRLTDPAADFHTVSAGLFENAAGFPLTKEIFIDRKPGGYAFAGAHARLTEAEFFASIGVSAEGNDQ